MTGVCTCEEAVLWMRDQPEYQELVRACYFDDPVVAAARRFADSPEWTATRRLLKTHIPGEVLDLGAGRGIVSHAFAGAGCCVTALEPDVSDVIGRGAINVLSSQTGLKIDIVPGFGEDLPFADGSFDVVYARAVLHHARDLSQVCRQVSRVLRPGGVMLAVREHVISRTADLPAFLASHPLHWLHGGEHAYRRADYQRAMTDAGLRLRKVLGPYDTPINYAPQTQAEFEQRVRNGLSRRVSHPVASLWLASPWCLRLLLACLSQFSRVPGRLFAFLGVKA